jgi:hypothetical protein
MLRYYNFPKTIFETASGSWEIRIFVKEIRKAVLYTRTSWSGRLVLSNPDL